MPVAALISGMMTLIASSPNMIIESSLRGRCLAPLDFFSWTPFGLAVLAAAIAFMLAARGLLSKQITAKDAAAISPTAYILRQRVAYKIGLPSGRTGNSFQVSPRRHAEGRGSTLRPLDDRTIVASVAKTRRAVIVDEGWRSGSLAAEICARIIGTSSLHTRPIGASSSQKACSTERMIVEPKVGGIQKHHFPRIAGLRTMPLLANPTPNSFAVFPTSFPVVKKDFRGSEAVGLENKLALEILDLIEWMTVAVLTLFAVGQGGRLRSALRHMLLPPLQLSLHRAA